MQPIHRARHERLTSKHPGRNIVVVMLLALTASWFADLATSVLA
jgi:hypothetical protein